MSKERLEEIAYNVGVSIDGEKALMSSDDYDFLYNYAREQSERVEELEAEIDTLTMAHDNTHRELKQFKAAFINLSSDLATITRQNEQLVKTNTSLAQQTEFLTIMLKAATDEDIRAEVSG